MKKHLLLFVLALFSFCMGAWAADWGDGTCGGVLYQFTEKTGTLELRAADANMLYESGVMLDYSESSLSDIPWYDEREQILTVKIKSDVSKIGAFAFYGCKNLTSVISTSTSTTSISVETIGNCAFYNCSALETISFNYGLTSIGDCAFWNCTSLTSVTLPTTLQTIGGQAFSGCTKLASTNLSSLSNLTTIGNSAFWDCPLTTIDIPAKVTSIGTSAFSPYNLTSISVNSNNAVYEAANNCLIKKPVSEGDFASLIVGSNRTSITIPDGVAIENSAFAGCNKIESLTFEGTYSIYQYAFSNCTSLKDITIKSCAPRYFDKTNSFYGLTTKNIKLYVPAEYVDDYVDGDYSWNIFDIYVLPGESAKFNLVFKADGETVSTVPVEYRQEISESNYPVAPEKVGHTFSQWTGVPTTMPAKDVEVTAKYTVNSYTITYMVDDEQYGDVQTYEYGATVTSPATPTKTKHKFSGWNPGIPSTMPAENLTITGSFIPLGGDGIEWSLSGGNSGTLAITGSGAMYDYTSDSYVPWLQAATGESTVGYYGISKITIADGITTIGDYAFFKCNSNALTTVTLPSALVAIGKAAFAHCSGLTSIVIPAKVATIGADAFRRCTNLSSVTCLATTPPQLKRETGDEGVFAGIKSGAKLYVPASSLTAYAKSSWSNYFDICVKEGDTAPTFTITFDTDGGSAVAPITQEYKTAVTAPTNPTKAGYTFAGWEPAIPSTMPAENMTIKAKWTAKTYTITFDTQGGSTVAPITQEYNTAVTAPTDPTKTGYTFDGWDKNIPSTMPAENVTITAKWKVNQYTITFNTDGGSSVATITQDYGTAVNAPANPTKEGYTFNGWNPALPSTMPAKNETHTAQWTINQYTITFDTNGGSTVSPIKQNYNTTVTAPAAPTKEGYTFAGWDKEVPSTMPAENVTITAKWTINQYTITFDVDGGTAVAPITQDYGTAVTAPAAPTKTGYTFAGWDAEVPATMPAGDMTVKAQWTINKYTITFDTDGGTAIEAITQDYGTAVTAPADPTKTGYTFAGWDVEIPATMPAENVTITAKWTINQYTITFDTDGGTEIAAITQAYKSDVTAPADPTKTGYTFAGWDAEVPATMPAEDVTIKAQWTINQYTITFDTNGGSEIAAITQDYNTNVKTPANPTKEGYTFTGWDKQIPETMPAEDMTITALWAIGKYSITFVTDGGTAVNPIVQDYGTGITAPVAPTKEGYTFVGWEPAVPATMPEGGLTVKAQWTANQYTITFDVDGGTAVASITRDYNTAITAPADPTKTGYTFAGWSPALPETMPAENRTVKATWTINQYTITFNTDGGSTVDPITQDYNTAVAAPTNPTKTGYTFAGWDVEIPATMPAESVTITAQWTYTPTIVDGEEYTATENMQAASLTYTRTLPNTKWNALYVPFEIPVSMLSDYEVAYVNDVHSYDRDDNGVIDDFSMEIIKIKSGVLNANYPYLIRAKNDEAKAMNIILNNITLYAAKETSVDCSSVVAEFKVTGTYRKIAGIEFSTNEYALSNGTWVPFAEDSELKPGRLYLQITEREGISPVKVSTMAMTRINIHVKGEESSTSVEEMIMQGQQPKEEVIYDLMGRRVQNPVKGYIYIVNGKKRVY